MHWRIMLFGAVAFAMLNGSVGPRAEPIPSKKGTADRNAPAASGGVSGPADARKLAPAAPLAIPLDQALYLIRSTLLTLNDANRSGNYSVLRDLAAPDFQTNNSAADLALIFTDLRQRRFDLFAAAVAVPQMSAAPALDAQGRLRLTGYFPTNPLRIEFDLLYQKVGERWRLFGIAIATPPANNLVGAQNP